MDNGNQVNEETLLSNLYEAFNRRDIEATLAGMHPDVDWPNGMEGGREHGRDAVRSYWTRQWSMINPHVEPLKFEKTADGSIDITVYQFVKDLSGNVLIDGIVHHVYTIADGLILKMDIVK